MVKSVLSFILSSLSSELIFARSDVSQLKQIPGKGTAEAIFANAKYKFIFKHN